MTGELAWRFTAAIVAVVASAATAAAQAVVVVGTGDPDIDVPAVQAAVDQGGRILLKGHFSFNNPPTQPGPSMVLVSKDVVLSGTGEEGEMTTIEDAQETAFTVDAPGARVTIEGLHFIRATDNAVSVCAVGGLRIANNRIEGVRPAPLFADGIFVDATNGCALPHLPEAVSGNVWIVNNNVDVGATSDEFSLGIVVVRSGKSPDSEVDIHISENNVRNTSRFGIEVGSIGGRAKIEQNVVTMGAIGAGGQPGQLVNGIGCRGTGSYLVAQNSIDTAFPNAAGIRLDPQNGPIASAIVVSNDVTMSAPEGTVFGTESAGVEIRGSAQANVMVQNTIRGRARAALSLVPTSGGTPGNNTYVRNDLADFTSSLADVFVDQGVTNTVVVGRQGSVFDKGVGTILVPLL